MGAEQVSSCWADFSVNAEKMQNLMCVEWKCSGAKKSIGSKKCLGVKQGKCSRCRASVKFSWWQVNPK